MTLCPKNNSYKNRRRETDRKEIKKKVRMKGPQKTNQKSLD